MDSAAVSGDDMSDCEDANLVAVAPRRPADVILSHVPALQPHRLAAQGVTAPAAAVMQRSVEDIASGLIVPACLSGDVTRPAVASDLRMRRATSTCAMDALVPATDAVAAAKSESQGGNGQAQALGLQALSSAAAGTCQPASGSESLLARAGLCGVGTDNDLVWTFLAGMMLYVVSV
jgi:hypothetical protein